MRHIKNKKCMEHSYLCSQKIYKTLENLLLFSLLLSPPISPRLEFFIILHRNRISILFA